jgi:hypothetical protein
MHWVLSNPVRGHSGRHFCSKPERLYGPCRKCQFYGLVLLRVLFSVLASLTLIGVLDVPNGQGLEFVFLSCAVGYYNFAGQELSFCAHETVAYAGSSDRLSWMVTSHVDYAQTLSSVSAIRTRELWAGTARSWSRPGTVRAVSKASPSSRTY